LPVHVFRPSSGSRDPTFIRRYLKLARSRFWRWLLSHFPGRREPSGSKTSPYRRRAAEPADGYSASWSPQRHRDTSTTSLHQSGSLQAMLERWASISALHHPHPATRRTYGKPATCPPSPPRATRWMSRVGTRLFQKPAMEAPARHPPLARRATSTRWRRARVAIGGFPGQGEAPRSHRGVPTVGRIQRRHHRTRDRVALIACPIAPRAAKRRFHSPPPKRIAAAVNDFIGAKTAEPDRPLDGAAFDSGGIQRQPFPPPPVAFRPNRHTLGGRPDLPPRS